MASKWDKFSSKFLWLSMMFRANYRLAPSQWETSLHGNANEKQRYRVATSLIGWVQTLNQPWCCITICKSGDVIQNDPWSHGIFQICVGHVSEYYLSLSEQSLRQWERTLPTKIMIEHSHYSESTQSARMEPIPCNILIFLEPSVWWT